MTRFKLLQLIMDGRVIGERSEAVLLTAMPGHDAVYAAATTEYSGTITAIRRVLMARFLKRGMDASAIKAADAKVRETVDSILAQVDEKKDLAIRELSKKFDNWEPKDFRLSPAEIEQAIAQVSKRDLD